MDKDISDFYTNKTRVCKRCVCESNTKKALKRHLETHPNLDGEEWKDVVGYEGLYKVSNLGRIRSFVLGGKNGCIISQSKTRQGYKRLALSKNGILTRFLVHRLVANAFIPNPQNKPTVNHINGDKGDNRVCNLEWATQSENNRHAYKTGLHVITKKQYELLANGVKITKKQVREIRCLYQSGKSQIELHKIYGVSRAQICRIVNNKSRRSVI